jgi:hypothetical protein
MSMDGDVRDELSEAGRRALAQVEALDIPFGLERSAKFADGAINPDRFLATFHRDDLGIDAGQRLSELAQTLGLPQAELARVADLLDGAQLLHVGHEGGTAPVTKLYFEDAAALSDDATGPVLVHRSLKWPSGGVVRNEFYRWRPDRADAAGVRRWLDDEGGPAAGFAGRLLSPLPDDAPVLLLEVTAERNVRRSFDVNLYGLELSIGDMAAEIAAMVVHLGVSGERLSPWLARWGGARLGHVSGGVGADGLPFGTLYYGISARKGVSVG